MDVNFRFIEQLLIHAYSRNIYEKSDLKMIFDLTYKSFKVHKWSVKLYSGKIIDWEYGLPSGIRWTALFGTLTNVARAYLVERELSYITSDQNAVMKIVGQGDDDDIVLRSNLYGSLFFEILLSFGVTANHAKNFMSTKETEFLKNIVFENTVMGYPARKICGMVFISPEKKSTGDELFEVIDWSI